ncbi:MAG: TIGR02221 family CRISPR-associated protein [Deltaproteobacteria bacterium]|nr:TIGR02221 family CRISPR-associated protein [Deltaproteobacteria bacterium]
MARVYLSFLGTNDYLPCTYYFQEKEIQGIRFVQEATVSMNCRDWSSDDRILIFTTTEAEGKNWLDNGHTKNGERQQREGLDQSLKKLNLEVPIRNVLIPEGKSEAEIWEIFQVLFDNLQTNDQIVFDITHSFRSIPMLAMVVLNYAKVMKGINILGIYYGAFEILGSLKEAEKKPIEDRRVPIFDLTPFDSLLDWSLAIDRFLGSGDAIPIYALAKKEVSPLLKKSEGKDELAGDIKNLADTLKAFTQSLATCRCRDTARLSNQLRKLLKQCERNDLIKPLKPLLRKIDNRVSLFNGDDFQQGIQAAKWCLEHNLIQQGFTILEESLITHAITLAGFDPYIKVIREVAGQAMNIFSRNISEDRWKEPAVEHKEITNRFLEIFQFEPEIPKRFLSIVDKRNDLNHGGCREEPLAASIFLQSLGQLIDNVEKTILKAKTSIR